MARVNIKGLAKLKEQIGVKELSARVRLGLIKASALVQRRVVENRLSGQVLRRPTGRLAGSIRSIVTGRGLDSKGLIGTNVEYAAVHEFGFKGDVRVKAHRRVINIAFGKPIKETTVNVASHIRTMNMPERSFLRSALAANQAKINTILQKAIFTNG